MKIIFLYPKWTGDYGKIGHFAKKAGVYPPLNLAYLAAIAEELGHEVKIIDGEVKDMPISQMVDEVKKFNPDIIGITATSPFFHIAVKLAEALKEASVCAPVIMGGTHITVLKEEAFKPCFDYAFIGEAEKTFPSFLNHYKESKDISSVKGLLYRQGNEVKFTGEADPILDLDSLPMAARHLLPMDKYFLGTMEGLKNFTPIMTVRGCPFRCIFCSTKVFGQRIRKRSPKLVAEEIKSIIDKYAIKHFMFLDDTLTLDRNHILEICDLIKDFDITFEGSTRANLIDEELVKKMKEAGLIRISFGLESVDETIRKIMKKDVPLESYIKANKLTNKYGIETLNSCMMGLPGETKHTIKKTLSFLRDSKEIKQANISIAVPYPGTELYRMAKNKECGLKLMIDDFSQFRRYNCAAMQVGDLSQDDLIDLQNQAFASIYLAPWRWLPMIRKSGWAGVRLTFGRLVKCIKKGQFEMLLIDKNYWKKKI